MLVVFVNTKTCVRHDKVVASLLSQGMHVSFLGALCPSKFGLINKHIVKNSSGRMHSGSVTFLWMNRKLSEIQTTGNGNSARLPVHIVSVINEQRLGLNNLNSKRKSLN